MGLLLLALFCFPLGVGAIYALPLPRIINVEAGDLLAYYGTTFGIIGSFVADGGHKLLQLCAYSNFRFASTQDVLLG